MKLSLTAFIALAVISSAFAANPYCVAGYNVLTNLGMPPECTDYDWNGLHTNRSIQMCRPNHYYNYINIAPRWWGYNEATGQINDPTQLSAWVAANPGKVWIIANEPDLVSQDGLTIDQYVAMFHTYYTFIKPLDPTARFAIAGITGGSTAERFTYSTGWLSQVLAKYKLNYGVVMPIDIWNIHSYCGPRQISDPDRIISEFVAPFVNWCHTVENSAYAGCEVWITELPIGEWMGAVSPENVIWFMQHYMPRLEQAGISRFFWYVSSDWDGSQGSCALTKSGTVTAVGAAYAALAQSYPNPIPPVTPFVPAPAPEFAAFDFSGMLSEPWFNKGGYWSFADGELRHTGYYPWSGTTCCLLHTYSDVGVSVRVKVNSAQDPANWAAVGLRVADRFDTCFDSGYLVYLRSNGELGLHNKVDGTVASVPGAVADPRNYHTLRVTAVGYNIKVWLDDVLKIDWTDPNHRYTDGYVLAQVHKADASYDDFHVLRYPTAAITITDDGSCTSDLTRLRGSWTGGESAAGLQGYRYAIGTSAGADDVIGWTYTEQNSFDVPTSLTLGTTYYISVKPVYADGLEGTPGTSDGITAAAAASGIGEAKQLPKGAFVVLEDKAVSGVFRDFIYVQERDRSAGIRVVGGFAVNTGDVVSLKGTTGIDSTEAVLANATVTSAIPGDAPLPLYMGGLATGGSSFGIQAAPVDDVNVGRLARGLSPIGLLVRTSGLVTYVGNDYAYIDDGSGLEDGSGQKGVRLALVGMPVPAMGARAEVTACCGAFDVGGGDCARVLRPRAPEDVTFSAVANYLGNGSFETGNYSPWLFAGTGGGLWSGSWSFGITAYSGAWFFGVYGYNAAYSGAMSQSVSVPQGSYVASVRSRVYHGGNAQDSAMNRVGIDPTGGIDPLSPNVVWSAWDSQASQYVSTWRQIATPPVSVTGGRCTVFLQYLQQNPVYYHVNCFDAATLTAAP